MIVLIFEYLVYMELIYLHDFLPVNTELLRCWVLKSKCIGQDISNSFKKVLRHGN